MVGGGIRNICRYGFMIDDLVLGVVSGEVELSGRSVLTYMKPGDRSLFGGGKILVCNERLRMRNWASSTTSAFNSNPGGNEQVRDERSERYNKSMVQTNGVPNSKDEI